MAKAKCNLVLVHWSDHALTEEHLIEIAEGVTRLNPAVRAFVVPHHKVAQLKLLGTWTQPTLSLCFFSLNKRKLLPGRLLSGALLHKHGEYARLDAAGIPTPRWTIISPETRLDPAEWGPYVVEKPSAGRRGAHVRIRKTGRVRYVDPGSLPADHYGRQGPMIAQRFIYTGEYPSSYRAVTMFGDVLLSYRQISRSHGFPLKGRWNFRGTGGISIVSNTKDMDVELIKDEAVVALAERAHRQAFPEIPVLAFDIVRDCETGSLYILECHTGGSWAFSADVSLAIAATHNVDLSKQFDAIAKAAAVLARETPIRALAASPFRDLR